MHPEGCRFDSHSGQVYFAHSQQYTVTHTNSMMTLSDHALSQLDDKL